MSAPSGCMPPTSPADVRRQALAEVESFRAEAAAAQRAAVAAVNQMRRAEARLALLGAAS